MGLCALEFDADPGLVSPPEDEVARLVMNQLTEYFTGDRRDFQIPLDPEGTRFQHLVWDELRNLEYGHCTAYETIARRLGDLKLTRAVGSAIGRNPIPIIIPCHRVLGKSGELTGYSGGLWRKKWLLEHEGVLQQGMFD
jgi:methylated-DNA-[protein]-cysteine S-methyltransferase